jgi:hypothetical protein
MGRDPLGVPALLLRGCHTLQRNVARLEAMQRVRHRGARAGLRRMGRDPLGVPALPLRGCRALQRNVARLEAMQRVRHRGAAHTHNVRAGAHVRAQPQP